MQPAETEAEVPLWRLYLLRAMFALFVVGGFIVHPPWMLAPDPSARGMLDSMLAGLWVLSFLGLRYPLKMLPVFLFEFVWKTIWLLAFGLPQWMAGRADPQLGEDLIMIGLGPLVFGLIVPWGYVFRTYVAKAGPPWWPGPSSPGLLTRGEHEASLARLYVMRAIALLFIVGGFSNYLPGLLNPDPTARGMLISMLGGLWVLAYIALRNPLLMLPVFLYELVWKAIWLLFFGLPQWSAGRVDPQLGRDLFEIGLFPFVFALIIPWGYFWRHYVRAPGDRWR